MNVSEVMTPRVELARPDMTMAEAAKRMRDDDLGALPVGENDRLIGMITDRDICCRGVAEGHGHDHPIRHVMSEGVAYCFQDDDADEAADIMARHQIRRLPVLDRDKRLVGIVALGDLARSAGGAAGRAAEGVSKSSEAPRHM